MRHRALEPLARARFVAQRIAGVRGANERVDALGIARVLARRDRIEFSQRDRRVPGPRILLRALDRRPRRHARDRDEHRQRERAWHDAASMSKIDLSLKDAFRRARDSVEGHGIRV